MQDRDEGTLSDARTRRAQDRDTPAPAGRHARASLADLLAFLGVLVLAGGLVFLLDRTGQLSARLAFAGVAGLVAACVNAWRRLRRVELRRWRSGQVTYRGRRVTVVSAWGVEGQPPPTIEPPDAHALGEHLEHAAAPRGAGRAPSAPVRVGEELGGSLMYPASR